MLAVVPSEISYPSLNTTRLVAEQRQSCSQCSSFRRAIECIFNAIFKSAEVRFKKSTQLNFKSYVKNWFLKINFSYWIIKLIISIHRNKIFYGLPAIGPLNWFSECVLIKFFFFSLDKCDEPDCDSDVSEASTAGKNQFNYLKAL